MDSAKITFEKKTQTLKDGRKTDTWATHYVAWADLPALSVREQTDVHNRSLIDAITLEVRMCEKVKEITANLKDFRVVYDGRTYTINSTDKSRKRQGWIRLLASRAD